MSGHTPAPWGLCHHLKSIEHDKDCSCGYRGVIYGPEYDGAFAICQPGHDAEIIGQEGLGPRRYPREVEIANAHLIAASPDLLAALIALVGKYGFRCGGDDQLAPAQDQYPEIKQAMLVIVKAEGRP
jgi:hypothetical protein